jgi:hypothetical protein
LLNKLGHKLRRCFKYLSENNTEIQRLIDITVAFLLIEGSLHADAIVIGREGIALEVGGPALELETKQVLQSAFLKLMEC